MTTIGFLGAGNMATALIAGLINKGTAANQLFVYDTTPEKTAQLAQHYGISVATSADDLLSKANILVLAVKPQSMATACATFSSANIAKPSLWISIAAGLPTERFSEWLGPVPLVRAMPNTPAMCGLGATGLFANPHVSNTSKDIAESIFKAVGIAAWVSQEEQIDAITALSGSGPAYFFYFFEAMLQAAIDLGLPAEVAAPLIVQTAQGAATMAAKEGQWNILRERVTSPGGTTAAGLAVLEQHAVNNALAAAITAAAARAKALSEN